MNPDAQILFRGDNGPAIKQSWEGEIARILQQWTLVNGQDVGTKAVDIAAQWYNLVTDYQVLERVLGLLVEQSIVVACYVEALHGINEIF